MNTKVSKNRYIRKRVDQENLTYVRWNSEKAVLIKVGGDW